jgi:hypothetical protein
MNTEVYSDAMGFLHSQFERVSVQDLVIRECLQLNVWYISRWMQHACTTSSTRRNLRGPGCCLPEVSAGLLCEFGYSGVGFVLAGDDLLALLLIWCCFGVGGVQVLFCCCQSFACALRFWHGSWRCLAALDLVCRCENSCHVIFLRLAKVIIANDGILRKLYRYKWYTA